MNIDVREILGHVPSLARAAAILDVPTSTLRDRRARDRRFPARTTKGWPMPQILIHDAITVLERATPEDLREMGITEMTRQTWIRDYEAMLVRYDKRRKT